jgi:hypothetical protein
MQSEPITTNDVSSNPTQARCTVQHYVIKFVSDLLRQIYVSITIALKWCKVKTISFI